VSSADLYLEMEGSHLSSLFTKSPKPGVSTIVSFRRTPFSSISRDMQNVSTRMIKATSGPLTSADALDGNGARTLLRGLERRLARVERGLEERIDECGLSESRLAWMRGAGERAQRTGRRDEPTTMAVNWKPLRTLLRWTWFGRLEKPTNPIGFFWMAAGLGVALPFACPACPAYCGVDTSCPYDAFVLSS
jgi:hypothetical protein